MTLFRAIAHPSHDGKNWVAQCQGFGRYAVACRRHVRVDAEGYAHCAAHRSQRHWQEPGYPEARKAAS